MTEKEKESVIVAKKQTDEVALDFSEVKPFEALSEEPLYKCRVDKLENGTARSSGADVSNLELVIVSPEEVQGVETIIGSDGKARVGDFMEDAEGKPIMVKAAGRRLFRTYTLESRALPFLHEFIKAADPTKELGKDFIYRPAEYVGLEVGVRIKNEAYEEQVRARVHRIVAAPSS